MFGKSLSEYIDFQKPILMLLAAVWAVRLGMSLAGVPVAGAKFVSITVVLVIGALYYGWAVARKGFGSFKQLYGLNLVQGVFSQTLVAAAIVLAIIMGKDNIFSIPEFSFGADGKTWGHVAAHLFIGTTVGSLVAWLAGSLILFVTTKVTRDKAPSVARA